MPPDDPLAPFELDPAPTLVRQAANEVYRGRRRGEEVYARITFADHRARGEVEAELDWLQALHEDGAAVVRPLLSRGGRLVEEIRWRGQTAFVVCTAAAPGRHAEKPRDFTPAVVEGWATLLADLHRHARGHAPRPGARRPPWHADRVLEVALADDAPETRPAQERLRALVAWLRGLDADPEAFGLTHADLHLGNVTVTLEGGAAHVTAFDFDDACYHWFVHDLAVGVTSIRKAGWEAPGAFDAAALEGRFVAAYARAGTLGPAWLARIEPFVELRIALSACWASRSFQAGALDEGMADWYRRSLPWWLAQLGARSAVPPVGA
jgi:Ser/Thr protein kinase RdoA (MazF antagonist)